MRLWEILLGLITSRREITSHRSTNGVIPKTDTTAQWILANRAHDLITKIAHELHERGTDGRNELLSLLRNCDSSVRLWAAVHSLGFASSEAESVLEDIAAGQPGLLRLSAEVSLTDWRNAQLKIP